MNQRTKILSLVISLALIVGAGYAIYANYSPVKQQKIYVDQSYRPVTQDTLAYYTSLNNNNSKVYYHDINTPCSTYLTITNSSGAYRINTGSCAKLNAVLTTQDPAANAVYLKQGQFASCLIECTSGVIYYQDPTCTGSGCMTNGGHDWMFNCRDFGTAQAVTCASETATTMELSVGTSYAFTDSSNCGGSAALTGNGDAAAAGTFSAGTPSTGSVTSTLVHTWTQSTAVQSTISSMCIITSTNSILVYEFGIGPDTLAVGNTLAVTASLTVT